MTDDPLRVVKVGGSLLDFSRLVATLSEWLGLQTPMRNVLVVGGSVWADEVRRLDARGRLSSTTAHWLAIRSMKLTSWLLCQMLPQAVFVDQLASLHRAVGPVAPDPVTTIFDCEQFLREVEPQLPGRPLPVGWQVTSDSIAARLAEAIRARELVLLKSTDPPVGSLNQAAREGLVDAHFPQAAVPLARVRWVNLRDPAFATAQWHPSAFLSAPPRPPAVNSSLLTRLFNSLFGSLFGSPKQLGQTRLPPAECHVVGTPFRLPVDPLHEFAYRASAKPPVTPRSSGPRNRPESASRNRHRPAPESRR